jgi:hypothetical protein
LRKSNVKTYMSSWLLLSAALIFAWLAYDAWRLAVPVSEVPYALTAKALGQDLGGVPLQEQEKRKEWSARYGIGDLSQTFWLWGIFSVACAVGSAAGFLA